VSPDGHTIQFEAGLTAGDASSTAALNAVPSVRKALTAVQHSIGATASGVAGEAPALYDVSSISDTDLIHIVRSRSLRSGSCSRSSCAARGSPLPNRERHVVVSGGTRLASIIFIKLAGSGGLTFLLPFLMFIFLLALGEDYNILVMTRIREEAHRQHLRDAVVDRGRRIGPTITSAGLVLAGTFLCSLSPREASLGESDPRHRHRPGARHLDGHFPGTQPARALDGVSARSLELVAGQAGGDGPRHPRLRSRQI